MDSWYAEIESKVYTIVKTRMLKKHKSKYPNMEFTTDIENNTPKVFPTIYLHQISQSETAQDFSYKHINMVNASFEVWVITNTSKEDTRKISAYVIDEMKSLAFNQDQQSPAMVDGDLFRCITRFSGLIDTRLFNR